MKKKSKQKLISELEEYINLPKCDGAFYIDGKWGCGKTHFIKGFLKEMGNSYKDKLVPFSTYVSLFGVNDVSILEKQVFGHTPIKECLSKVVVLDDLERCSIDIQKIFSFVNRIISDYSVKVILIGNEEEVIRYLQSSGVFNNKLLAAILSKDEDKYKKLFIDFSKEPLLYDSIKEKTIYRTASFSFVSNIFFDEILNEYDDETKKIVIKNKNSIQKIINQYQCTNFRTLKASVDIYQKIITKIKHIRKRLLNISVRKNILFVSFAYMINFKQGKKDFNLSKSLFLPVALTPMPSIQKYVVDLTWDEYSIINEIYRIKNSNATSKQAVMPEVIKKLNDYWAFKTDEELTKEVKQLVKLIEDNKISLNYYYKSLNILATYYGFGFKQFISLDDFTDIMTNNILSSDEDVDTDHELMFNSMPKSAAPYQAKLTDAFKKRSVNHSKNNVTKILMEMNDKSSLKISSLENEFRENKCFFSLVDVDALFEKIVNASSTEIIFLRTAISTIYSFSNLYDFYRNDFNKVVELKEAIEKYDFSDNKIKNRTIKWLVDDLTKYINQLKDPSTDW